MTYGDDGRLLSVALMPDERDESKTFYLIVNAPGINATVYAHRADAESAALPESVIVGLEIADINGPVGSRIREVE